MQISFNWLKEHVKLPDSVQPEEVAEKLKLSTVEVEGVIKSGALLDNVVIGKVLTAEKHPNADKLKVCKVDVGSEQLQIVCGGSNVTPGMMTVVAKVGAKVQWHGEGELVELKPTAIRGVESFGMICGADEVGLIDVFPKKDEKEIIDASTLKLKAGTPAAVAFHKNDTLLEIDNKSLSNRPDLWGHYGLAREVAVLYNREVKPYSTKPIVAGKTVKIKVKIEDQKLCSRYEAVAVEKVTIAESPAWLKEKLAAAGVRPINNVVDITNFVMLDLGQPMHAFDIRKLQSGKSKEGTVEIVVKKAKAGEEFTTLDGVKRSLPENALLIATPDKAVAIAGIMGGAESAVAPDTTTVVFEAANFDATSIRSTSTKIGLRTDSSARFEKSLDPTLCKTALERAAQLLLELCPGAVVASAPAEAGSIRLFKGPIVMPSNFISDRLGEEIPVKTIKKILERLGFGITENEKTGELSVTVPSWRATRDIRIAEDIVEEIARMHGYDRIASAAPIFPATPPERNPLLDISRILSDCLARDFGFTEVYQYSFVSAASIEKTGEKVFDHLELDNPLSKEKPYIRRMPFPNLFETLAQNAPEHDTIRIFEIGNMFFGDQPGLRARANGSELLPRQVLGCSALVMEKGNSMPWHKVRPLVDRIAAVCGGNWKVSASSMMLPFFHPARTGEISVNGEVVGHVFEVHPKVTQNFKLEDRVACLALSVTRLSEVLTVGSAGVRYVPLPQYPEVKRDIAFLIKKEIPFDAVERLFAHIDPLLKKAELFDVYEGEKIKTGYKSLAFHLTYGSDSGTLKSEQIDAVHTKVAQALKEILTAEVRS